MPEHMVATRRGTGVVFKASLSPSESALAVMSLKMASIEERGGSPVFSPLGSSVARLSNLTMSFAVAFPVFLPVLLVPPYNADACEGSDLDLAAVLFRLLFLLSMPLS